MSDSYYDAMFGGGSPDDQGSGNPNIRSDWPGFQNLTPQTGGNPLSVTTPGGTGSEATMNQASDPGRTAVQPTPAYQQTVNTPSPTYPTAAQEAPFQGIANNPQFVSGLHGLYQQYYGRNATPEEIAAHAGNPNGLNGVAQIFQQQFPNGAPTRTGASNGNNGATKTTGTGGVGFADPSYSGLVDLVNRRLGQLQTPQSFPQMDQLTSMLQANEAASKQRAQTFADQLGQRVGQLQKPLLSDANVVQQRALASNGLLGQMDNALARSRENVAQRGFDPRTSGLALNQQNQVSQNYSNAQAQIDAMLQQHNIAGDESRRNTATTLQGLAQQALQGGDLTALQNQSQAAQLENQLFNLNENRANQTLVAGQIPVDLTNQGYTNALNASNSAANPLTSILNLIALGNQQQGIQQTGQNSNASALAWWIQQALKL